MSDRTQESPVEEYKDLRAEILQSQQTRALALGFTFTALGVVAGIALASDNRQDQALVAGVLALGALLICAALHLTTVLTQRIDRLSDYIKTHLEPRLGYGWESAWGSYRDRIGAAQWRPFGRWTKPTGPLGTSKPLAVYYLVLILADVASFAAAANHPSVWAVIVVLVPDALGVYLALNLFFRFGWQLGWTALADEPRRTWPRGVAEQGGPDGPHSG
jgi:hypothetical protein